MLTFFIICALGGGTIVLAQLILSVFAIGGGHGLHLHHHAGPAVHQGPALPRAHAFRLGHHAAPATPHAPAPALRPVAQAAAPKAHINRTHTPHAAALRDHWAVSYLLGIFNLQGIVAGATVLGFAGLAASSAQLTLAVTLTIALASALAMMLIVGTLLRFMVTMDSDNTVQLEQAVGQLGTVYLSIPSAGAGQGKITVTLQHRMMEFPAITPQATPLSAGDQVIVVSVQKPAVMEVVSAEKYLRDVEPFKEGPIAS